MSTEETALPELTRRQEEILSLIVQSYTQAPEPVSSKSLVESFNLSYSSATVRNEMARLEELGYIAAPHTSAGRVPTAMGYRYFVKRLIDNSELSIIEQQHIADKFDQFPTAIEQWMRQAATMLARTARSASLITPPTAQHNRFKHLELIAIQGRLVLMVLVLRSGSVHQRMLNLAEPLQQQKLSEVADHINSLCTGLNANEVHVRSVQLPLLEREIAELAAELIEKADINPVRAIYRDGLSEVINSFPDPEGAQQAIRVFEEQAFLNMILGEMLTPLIEEGQVQVVIAGEGRWQDVNRLSFVITRYGVPGELSGMLGILGPTHINYGRAISTVRYVSSLMSDMLVELYSDSQQGQLPDGPENPENS